MIQGARPISSGAHSLWSGAFLSLALVCSAGAAQAQCDPNDIQRWFARADAAAEPILPAAGTVRQRGAQTWFDGRGIARTGFGSKKQIVLMNTFAQVDVLCLPDEAECQRSRVIEVPPVPEADLRQPILAFVQLNGDGTGTLFEYCMSPKPDDLQTVRACYRGGCME